MQGPAKVGLLVIVFLALLYSAYLLIGITFFKPATNTYYVEFADAGGTTSGTPVSMAGVKIGSVKQIKLISARMARATLDIDKGIQIPRGSTAQIGSSLISLGASPISIVPPEIEVPGFLANGDTILGGKSSPLDSFLPDAKGTIKELTGTLRATRKLLEDQSLKNKLTKLLETSSATLEKFGGMADAAKGLIARANGLVGQNQPIIAGAMRNVSLAMGDIRKSTQLIAKLIEDGNFQKQGLALLDSLNGTAKKAQDVMTSLNDLVGDPQMQSDLKATMGNVNKMTDSGTRIAANTEEITKNGITLSEKAVQLADKANEIADEAHTALQKISGFFGRGPSKTSIPKVQAQMDLLHEGSPNHWRMDIGGRVFLKDQFIDLGLYDAFEGNKIILQSGNSLGKKMDYRYGIYASKPGVGVDFRLAPRVSLRSDLFDINRPRFDLRTQIDFGSGFVGWLGLEKLFQRNAFVAGVGIRK